MGLIGPVMNFTFQQDAPRNVLLAQGIGITPFRSMLVHAQAHVPEVETTLIHVDGTAHLFRDITEAYATNAFYPTNPDAFREAVAGLDTGQRFYLSGSPKFIGATKRLLREKGVEASAIATDSFWGY